jgi:hypothetical protein
VVRQWKRRFEAGATAAVATNEDVVPVSALREAHQRIRELERLLGKKQRVMQPGAHPRLITKCHRTRRPSAASPKGITSACRRSLHEVPTRIVDHER